MDSEKFIENWYGSPISKSWDKDYEPLKNLSITQLKQMLEEYSMQANGADAGERQSNIPDVSNNEVAVCPKCASKDVIWTVYCNNCNEAM